MKKLFALIFVTAILTACTDNEAYDDVPQPIISFITQYWPNPIIESYAQPTANKYEVDIKNGPSLEFDGNYSWTDVDGEGLPLPKEFLFDQLPDKLYEYLEGGEYLNQVFEVERNVRTYKLDLLNIDLSYDISTGAVMEIFDKD